MNGDYTANGALASNYGLFGQPALITGAASGIGRGIALALAQAGADIVVNWLDDKVAAEQLCDEVEAMGRRGIAIRADVRDEEQVSAMFRTALSHFGTLHIVVANAGIQRDAAIEHMTLTEWSDVLDTNVTGQFLCAREGVREFLRRGIVSDVSKAAGKIVCVSSIHESRPWAGRANYAASKAASLLLMKSLAVELAPKGIRVNGVAPGAIKTSINQSAWNSPEALSTLSMQIPYQRVGDPIDIGRATAWLVSDMADYVTGASLVVDGGLSSA
jgi:glucose 1-dehydrogenase